MITRKLKTTSRRKHKPLYSDKKRKYKPKNRVYNRRKTRGKMKSSSFRSRFSKLRRSERFEKTAWTFMGFVGVVAMIGAVVFLFWLKKLTSELPDVENPFDNLASSTIYSSDGEVLYNVSPKEFSRDLLGVNEYVPVPLKWAFLSAEDSAFYEHPGVDFTALSRCIFYKITGGPECGGSTVTQQVILNTLIARESSYVRKVKDIILALQLERRYDKDQILNIYLNVVPQGGGRLGVKTGAKLYFDKDLDELSIAEMSVLASVIRNPSIYSPTVGSDLVANKERLDDRTDYILDQMIKNLDNINDRIKETNEANKDEEGYEEQQELTVEELEAAKEEAKFLEFKEPKVDIKAPHFVFYAIDLLQERGYNNGEPFTETEIQTGGLKIHTTLDYSLQEIAEEYVSSNEANHAGWYRQNYGAHNSALMTMRPSSGEIITMVGSKCYDNNEYISNCRELNDTEGDLFDPDVNVLDTLQSPGSTNKALGYYIAFNEGIISTASVLPDVGLNNSLSPGYSPKNWDGSFWGKGDVRSVFAQSRNLPPLFLIDTYGVQKYIDTAREFGYTTYGDPSGYGPSVILGGTDIKGIEHAQAFGVFANNGSYVQHEVISKITDVDGNVLYEHVPEKVEIATPAAAYLVNDVLNPSKSGSNSPVKKIRGRDVAGKTGTSENNRDTWFSVWSPEFVTVGWMGNNDNTPMASGAFGSTSAAPWIESYMIAIMGEFPDKAPFERPSGVVSASEGCVKNEETGETSCAGGAGLAVAGKGIPGYLSRKTITVCIDQPNRVARDIDKAAGFAVDQTFEYLKSPSARLQKDVDAYFLGREDGLPKEECDIPRTSDPTKPEAIIISPQPGATYDKSMDINARAFIGIGSISKVEFSIDGKSLASAEGGAYSGSVSLDGVSKGLQTFKMKIYDQDNRVTNKSISVYVGNTDSIGSLSLGGPSQMDANTATSISVVYSGKKDIENVSLYETSGLTGVTKGVANMGGGDGEFSYSWAPIGTGNYTLYAVAEGEDFNLSSNVLSITVVLPTPEEEGN